MTGVHTDDSNVGSELGQDFNILPNYPAQHFVETSNRVVEIKVTRLEDLLPAERQKWRSQGGLVGGSLYLLSFVVKRDPMEKCVPVVSSCSR